MPNMTGDDIEFGIYFDDKTALPELRRQLSTALIAAVDHIVANFDLLIIKPLIYGGKGWKPLIQTSAWRWLNSPKGFGQLGFSNATEPLKLLFALAKSWEVKKVVSINTQTENMFIGFNFRFADIAQLRKATIHPNAGQLNLSSDASWFDWIYSGLALTEDGFHFKRTGPIKGSRSSVIAGAEAGLMKKGGLWQVTPRFRLDLDRLIDNNEDKITNVIQSEMQEILAERTRD